MQKDHACRQAGFAPIIILIGILVLALVGGVYFFKIKTPAQKACTMDAKICPDGSSVGKSGPNCEFSPCPSPTPTKIISPEPTGSAEATTNQTSKKTVSLQGFLRHQTPYPSDLGYEYALELKTPFTDELNASGNPTQYRVEITPTNKTVKAELDKNIGKEVTVEGTMEWGYAESRSLYVTRVLK